jgi:pimeloyl-ACP methyl ester carboxylesterase
VTTGTVDAGDGIVVRCHGSAGPPVVWLHGYTMESRVWADLWRRLPGWTHVGIDLPGHGGSRPLAADERFPGLGRQVARVARDRGARHLVGLSFGSTVAVQAAIEAPEVWRSLVLGAPAVAGAPTDPGSAVRYGQLRTLYAEYGPGAHMTALWMASPPDIFRGAAGHPELWEALRTVIDRHPWRELADGAMASLTAHSQGTAELARIGARTLVLLGADDMPAFRYSAGVVTRSVPGSRAVEVPGAGHLCLLERPDLVAPVIDRHLRTAEAAVSPPSS